MHDPSAKLLQLATERFGELTEAERKMFEAAVTGGIADCRGEGEEKTDSDPNVTQLKHTIRASVLRWLCINRDAAALVDPNVTQLKHTIRASVLRWLCINRDAAALVDPNGIRIIGAKIEGELNLFSANVDFLLALLNCVIQDGINLQDAQTRTITLSGSSCSSIKADRLEVRGSMHLAEGFTAQGEVRLPGATIKGPLICTNGHFANTNPQEFALGCDGASIGGHVFLNEKFTAQGEVRLLGATIKGQLNCSAGHFANTNPQRFALACDSAFIGGDVFFDEKFTAQGEVRLPGATIKGQLNCTNGHFTNPDGDALRCDGASIDGGVFLSKRFTAQGTVDLSDATIKGQLNCSAGHFANTNPQGFALGCNGASIDGSVFLNEKFTAQGTVRLLGATIKGQLNCRNGYFASSDAIALACDSAFIDGSVFLNEKFTAQGEVRLPGATIKGQLNCTNGHFTNPDGNALNCERASIGGHVFLNAGFEAQGEVRLLGATIGGQLNCSAGHFANTNPQGFALGCDGASIGGHVFLNEKFTAQGTVRLLGATIGGHLVCIGAKFLGDGGNGLDATHATIIGRFVWKYVTLTPKTHLFLSQARIGLLEDSENSWPAVGKLSLNGLIYEDINGPPQDTQRRKDWLTARLKWLQLQADDDFSVQPYEHLAGVLRRTGNEADAREVLYFKQEALRKHGHLGVWGQFWRWLLKWSIGHGYYSYLTFVWALLFTTIGEAIFNYAHQNDMMISVGEDPLPFHSVMYSLDTLLPIINFHQEAAWIPQAGTWILWYFWFHILIGWVLSTLAVVGFTGLVRKD